MRYHNITKDDMLNGSGLRVVLWVSGCLHGCKECHNPITWDINGGLFFDQTAKEEVYAELSKPYIEGITLSGGDPLHPSNREDIGTLISDISTRFPEKNIWLYTGYTWDEISDLPFLPNVDVLVDGEFEKDKMDPKLYWRGSANQRVIDVKKTLNSDEIVQINLGE